MLSSVCYWKIIVVKLPTIKRSLEQIIILYLCHIHKLWQSCNVFIDTLLDSLMQAKFKYDPEHNLVKEINIDNAC